MSYRLMDGIIEDAAAIAETLAFFAAAIGLFLIGLAVWALVSFLITCVITYIRYRYYLAEETARFPQIMSDVGADGNADDVLRSVFGVSDFVNKGYTTSTDWVIGSLFGVAVEEEEK